MILAFLLHFLIIFFNELQRDHPARPSVPPLLPQGNRAKRNGPCIRTSYQLPGSGYVLCSPTSRAASFCTKIAHLEHSRLKISKYKLQDCCCIKCSRFYQSFFFHFLQTFLSDRVTHTGSRDTLVITEEKSKRSEIDRNLFLMKVRKNKMFAKMLSKSLNLMNFSL